ncbi:MAG: hypothetical protein SGI77_20770 [Pirellulaceae bacterium]|nr:hypothetical protein [Pirellulaceae bacterium]
MIEGEPTALADSPTVVLSPSTQATDPVSDRSIASARTLLSDTLKPKASNRRPSRSELADALPETSRALGTKRREPRALGTPTGALGRSLGDTHK